MLELGLGKKENVYKKNMKIRHSYIGFLSSVIEDVGVSKQGCQKKYSYFIRSLKSKTLVHYPPPPRARK